MVELFEAAKKAADVANAKGILSGKSDALRCVEAISLLMKMNVTPKPNEPRSMFERLERLSKHKDRTICSAATALLQLWRQRIREQERKESSAIKNPRRVQRTCGQGFTRESTKAMKTRFLKFHQVTQLSSPGILSGKSDALRCVEAISLLMKMNVTPKPNEPRKMIERLERLAKHKDRTICSAATALLQLWRQRIREQERKESSAIKNPRRVQRTCGQGFTRESTKAMKLVM
ncbi:hypothetical protein F2Q68_00024643 [Brassica cretica]|uniref:TFIIS N-terminal domain-containing protein n=1 Tax=Brassica cretica TaxID=69181 RepID=A0A8S9IJT1_BRACR|nr:hypothetical protein F2Q68_00024643 [Brassica cretica]